MRFLRMMAMLAGALAGCAETTTDDEVGCEDAKCDGFGDGSTQRLWDFAYVYPKVEKIEDLSALLSLSDLGLDRTFFDAAFGHMTGAFPLPGAAADDAPRSPEDPQILQEECLKDPASWRVTQVRFAPYQLAVPGTVSALRTWATRTGSRLDQAIEVRLSVHPFCENPFNPGVIDREDQAMHLIYAVHPDDAKLAADVFDNAAAFTSGQLAGTSAGRTASYAALEAHRKAISSDAYKTFHKAVVGEWLALANTYTATATDFTDHDTTARSLRATGLAPFEDRFGSTDPKIVDLSHPGLRAKDSGLRPALATLIKKYARRDRIDHVALMFTVGSQDPLDDFQETRWFFSLLRPGRFAQLAMMPAGADKVYGEFSPAPLETFVAVAHAKGVDLVKATDAGFYSESRGAFTGPRNVYPAKVKIDGKSVTIKPEVDKVDYKELVRLDEEQGHDMPALPTGKPLIAAMRRFADVEAANASTTPCDRCHDAQNFIREGSATGYRAAQREESAYQFHMITTGTLSLRTISELDREAVEARKELGAH